MSIDHVTAAYLERMADPGDPLRDATRRAPYVPEWRKAHGGVALPRPLFYSASTVASACADVNRFYDLLVALPDRLFGGDHEQFYRALGMDEHTANVLVRSSTGRPPRHGRADVLPDGTGFRLLEPNTGTELGGTDMGEFNRAMMQLPEFAAFAAEHGLTYTDIGEQIATIMRRVAEPVTGGTREPVVGLLEWIDGFEPWRPLYLAFQDVMKERGIEVLLAEITEVSERDGKLYVRDVPVDLAWRYYGLHQVADHPDGEALIAPVLAAHRAGGTPLYASLETFAFAFKDTLVFLSDPRYRHAFSAEEAEFLDRFIPWTRKVVPGPVDVDGTEVDLIAYCQRERESLILKPHAGYAGAGTVAGWEASEDEWAKLLADNATGDYVVQRRVIPQIEPMIDPVTGDRADWYAVMGLFYTEAGSGGWYVRAQRPGGAAVVGRGSTSGVGGVFVYPDA